MISGRDLPPLPVGARRDRVQSALDQIGLEVLVVTDPTNIRWMTGFTGSSAVVLAATDRWVLYTDSRYATQAPDQLGVAGVDAEVVIGTDPWTDIVGLAASTRVGLEADHLSWSRVGPLLDAVGPDGICATSEVIETLRARKDEAELARIRAAAAIVDEALAAARPQLVPGISEREIARFLDDFIRSSGATGPAYDTIVAAGANSALPHAHPTDRPLERGDLMVIDVGAEVDGYRSDMTRSFVVGEPTADQRRQLDVVLDAQRAGLAAVRAGVSGASVDGAARAVIDDAGWADAFGHGTGHGVGLDIHELPRVNASADSLLEATMVVTVEPGVYLPGFGGVRWEDLLVVTDDGAERLTHSPTDPVLIG